MAIKECDRSSHVGTVQPNNSEGRGWKIILFQHTMLLRNRDGAVKKNGLIPFPDNRLQKAFEHLLLSCTKGECYRYGAMFSMWYKCFWH